ncbi:hypothetical protein HanRHA438_Chr04g0202461 [Helianthus annuus]|nr:hypothetical protein HanRHA438_Chr04g0202461 [Helianthus annuus]
MVNHHMSHSSNFSFVKFLIVPLRGGLLMTIQSQSHLPPPPLAGKTPQAPKGPPP